MTATSEAEAMNALAKGIAAQQNGSEVAALAWFMEAVNFDPGILEAASRVSILSRDISGGSMGRNVRNDLQWYDQWKARLEECRRFAEN